MEMLYYTATAIALYVFSDWILDRIERARGARFPNRTLVFFAIILTLTVLSFQAIRYFLQA